MMHLSRLSEELILWNSPAFGWVEMGDNVTTGSSIMPQKKNPDVAELTRGKAGRVFGDLISLLTLMKALPLAYNKDMQEDKEPLFDAFDTAHVCLAAMNTLLQNTTFRTDRMAAALRGDFSTATDLADYLVRQGLPFRQAHEVVGKLVAQCFVVRARPGRPDGGRLGRRLGVVRRGRRRRPDRPARQRRRPRVRRRHGPRRRRSAARPGPTSHLGGRRSP